MSERQQERWIDRNLGYVIVLGPMLVFVVLVWLILGIAWLLVPS